MQDRFNFRCYNKKDNTIYDVYSFDKNFIKANPINTCVNSIRTFKTSDCILIQCTGLKDKNGKLIFEGDILKDKYGALHPISWNVKGFYEADTFAVAGFYNAIQEDMEVIGNIYQNLELLGGEQC